MAQLLTSFSISAILLCIIAIAVAFKKYSEYRHWLLKQEDCRYEKRHEGESIKADLKNIAESVETLQESVNNLTDTVDELMASDRDDIKSYITQQHHYFCYQKHWIDDYTMEILEKRYEHYQKEGGNSFIAGFMNDLRALPKVDPSQV